MSHTFGNIEEYTNSSQRSQVTRPEELVISVQYIDGHTVSLLQVTYPTAIILLV